MEEIKLKEEEQKKEENTKQTSVVGGNDKEEVLEKKLSSKSSSAEQDLDTFLLGDLEDSDGGPGIHLILNCSQVPKSIAIVIVVQLEAYNLNWHIIRMCCRHICGDPDHTWDLLILSNFVLFKGVDYFTMYFR